MTLNNVHIVQAACAVLFIGVGVRFLPWSLSPRFMPIRIRVLGWLRWARKSWAPGVLGALIVLMLLCAAIGWFVLPGASVSVETALCVLLLVSAVVFAVGTFTTAGVSVGQLVITMECEGHSGCSVHARPKGWRGLFNQMRGKQSTVREILTVLKDYRHVLEGAGISHIILMSPELSPVHASALAMDTKKWDTLMPGWIVHQLPEVQMSKMYSWSYALLTRKPFERLVCNGMKIVRL